MLKFISLCLVLLSVSCTKHFKPDLDKVKTYSFELEKEWPYALPYLLELSKDNKTLWYIGARHENSKNSLDHKTLWIN